MSRALFIGGTGRSGTTILKRLFLRHPEVVGLPFELRAIIDPDGALNLVWAMSEGWSPYQADIALKRFIEIMRASARSRTDLGLKAEKVEARLFRSLDLTPRKYLGRGLLGHVDPEVFEASLSRLVDRLSTGASAGSHWATRPLAWRNRIFETRAMPRAEVEGELARFFGALYASMEGGGAASHWVEDTPFNLLHAHRLLEIFEGAHVFVIHRDPRDVVASYRTFRWGGDEPDVIAGRIAGVLARWFELRPSLPAESFTEIKLEELAAEPEVVLRRICERAGVAFDDALLEIPLNKVHAGRWKQELEPEVGARIQSTLTEGIRGLGYTLESDGP